MRDVVYVRVWFKSRYAPVVEGVHRDLADALGAKDHSFKFRGFYVDNWKDVVAEAAGNDGSVVLVYKKKVQ